MKSGPPSESSMFACAHVMPTTSQKDCGPIAHREYILARLPMSFKFQYLSGQDPFVLKTPRVSKYIVYAVL